MLFFTENPPFEIKLIRWLGSLLRSVDYLSIVSFKVYTQSFLRVVNKKNSWCILWIEESFSSIPSIFILDRFHFLA
jgi:hypothetical protein